MTRTERALALAAAAALACQVAERGGPPRPEAALPPHGFQGGATTIEILGSGFLARAVHDVGERKSRVDAGYRAWIGGAVLEDVVWLGTDRLRARVPSGLPLGLHDLEVEGPYGRGSVAGAFEVLPGSPPALGASLAVPRAVNVGQEVLLEIAGANDGEAVLEGVQAEVSLAGTAWLAAVPSGIAETPHDLPPGGRGDFSRRYLAQSAGEVEIEVELEGADPRTGDPVTAFARGALAVERPAALDARLEPPADPLALGERVLRLTVTNTGQSTAVGVRPELSDAGSTGGLILVSAPEPVALPGGTAASLDLVVRVTAAGILDVTAAVTGVDANDGGLRTATASARLGATAHTASVIAEDPFRDGSTFAYVAPLGGFVYAGPSRTGTGIVRTRRDGSGAESLALSFVRDAVGGNVMGNQAYPYASIGHTGCETDSFTRACGPDDEDGRGLLTSVTLGGEEWLVLGGARSGGDLDYVYLARASASPLAFAYVDLSQLLGGNTRGFSAAVAHGERLYLGFPDNGGNRPYGVALLARPSSGGGLDAIAGTHALELGLHDAYAASGGDFASVSMVDAVAALHGRLYFFDDVGCLVSTTATPATKDDFRSCSPAAGAAYDRKASVEPTRQHDLEPRERAWPQVVAWKGLLYAARNTYDGPQLWACDPARGADPGACEAGDWTLLAADPATLRTRLGKPGVTAASALLATETHLYVGLDDPVAGLHVFRTRAALPAIEDFRGRDGCAAGTPGCEGLGGDGLGTPAALTRIFDAKVVTGPEGRTDLFLTAGNGRDAFRLIRMDP